jgi:hypothetical protein
LSRVLGSQAMGGIARVAVAPTDEAVRCTNPARLSSGKSPSLISVLDFILET